MAIPVTVNDTRWHGIEAPLTRFLRTEAIRQLDVSLDSQSADYILSTEIGRVRRRHFVGTVVTASDLQIHWSFQTSTGDIIASGTFSRSLEFLPGQGEDPYSAFDEISASAAESILMEIAASLHREVY